MKYNTKKFFINWAFRLESVRLKCLTSLTSQDFSLWAWIEKNGTKKPCSWAKFQPKYQTKDQINIINLKKKKNWKINVEIFYP